MTNECKYFVVENQKISIDKDIQGEKILDIGGGGEGIIGLCYKERVVSIDRREDELLEAPSGPLKIVMDAGDLKFLDHSFHAATSFFTLMYIPNERHKEVFSEIHRVLVPGGTFTIWDVEIPQRDFQDQVFVVQLKIKTPFKEVSTGYGVAPPNKINTKDYFVNLGRETGFQIQKTETNDQTFKIIFKKI